MLEHEESFLILIKTLEAYTRVTYLIRVYLTVIDKYLNMIAHVQYFFNIKYSSV